MTVSSVKRIVLSVGVFTFWMVFYFDDDDVESMPTVCVVCFFFPF